MKANEIIDPSVKIEEARAGALDQVLAGMAIVGVFGAPLSVSRALVTGWLPAYSFHLIVGFAVVGLWIYRKQLSLNIKFWTLAAFMWGIGLFGIYTYGMLGAGTWWLASSALIAGMVISPRVGAIIGSCAIGAMVLAAGGFTSGLLTVSLDLDAYMAAFSSWATYILVAAWLPMVIFSAFVKNSEVVVQLAEETARAQRALQELADVDSLTGAFRPHVLEDKLQRAIVESAERKDCVGVVFIDLDRFKLTNDTYGHAAGDAMLKAVAERAATVLRSGDVISRKGGDEFVVVLPGIKTEAEAEMVSRKLRKVITAPFVFEGQPLEIALSMGVAVAAHGDVSGKELLKAADELMYEAKRSGNRSFFSRTLAA